MNTEQASSEIYGTLLMVAITVILAAFILMWSLPLLSLWPPEDTPTIFEIRQIFHYDKDDPTTINFSSRIILRNSGDVAYKNDLLSAEIYCNKIKIPCVLNTFNGHEFIKSHHFKIQGLSGQGCRGEYWRPSETLCLDMTDRTIRPGDLIRVNIIYKPRDQVISQDTYRA